MDEMKPASPAKHSLLDRLKSLRHVWRDIAASLGAVPKIAPELPEEDAELLRAQMRDCLQGRGGEVSARARAANLGRSYLGLNAEGRMKFLTIMAEEFGPDHHQVDAAMSEVSGAGSPGQRLAAMQKLRLALESAQLRLLTQFNGLPDGVKFLVDLRAEMLSFVEASPAIQFLERDLRDLLAGWFDEGFLEMQRITWRSPAVVLEKIMAYEAVHAIQSWRDLKNRLDSDRRFYAFFHPRMPDEPLIFVEVALVQGLAANVNELLDEQAPVGDSAKADTAIFYSINNAQKGLAGISFGNFLIKRVVDSLSQEFPRLKTFATLSPIPGFRAWLDRHLREEEFSLLNSEEYRQIISLPGGAAGLAGLLQTDWSHDNGVADSLKPILLRLSARYLCEKREGGARVLDPVAHFHLTNGARMERLNWLADRSQKGLAQSAGLMINYLYNLSDIEANHEAYSGQGRVITSSSIKSLLRQV